MAEPSRSVYERGLENAETLVHFADVQKTYDGETLVVKNLNLAIRKGEFLTMLGPSGSGKTTTLLMIAGFEVPTHGDIVLAGQSLKNVPPHKRDIGMVFQNYALFPHMTVEENLAFPLQVRNMSKAEIAERLKRVLGMVQLSEYAKRRPGQLSGGQQQRVAVARALVFDPKLVLMDEPLGALDRQLREQMQLEVKHLHEQLGITVVYVTHDQGEALTMSNRIAVFSDGEIQQLATPDTLYEEPQNSFVAQFIGENNKLRGTVKSVNGTGCEVEIEGGDIVRALSIKVAGVGTPTLLSLRPERVKINPPEGSMPNVFPARVEELIYLGDHIRTRVSVCGHNDFVVKVPNAEGRAPYAPGAQIAIGWRAEDCRALDAPD
ncbi:MAG: ABC transporter ATP-binding protein [Alphaproteobacteria bacterium]